jgi:type IV secretory pathway VirB10-like protein
MLLAMSRITTLLLLLLGVTFAVAAPCGERTLYRWVDENGTVHITDQKPPGVDVEIMSVPGGAATRTPPAPPAAPAPTAAPTPAPEVASRPDEAAATPSRSIAEMSLEELDRRCEQAREQKIAPLRDAEIARCKAEERPNDPDWCERFYADFGAGGRTVSGGFRPRLFGDLPECVEAEQERRRRPLR